MSVAALLPELEPLRAARALVLRAAWEDGERDFPGHIALGAEGHPRQYGVVVLVRGEPQEAQPLDVHGVRPSVGWATGARGGVVGAGSGDMLAEAEARELAADPGRKRELRVALRVGGPLGLVSAHSERLT